MYYLYIIQSEYDKSYYIGQTDNLNKRLAEHNCGKNNYTKHRTPWNLVHKEFYNTRGEAMKRENEIKRKKRKSYIEWLIKNPRDSAGQAAG